MGYWRCDKCGGTDFTETISGGRQGSVFDKNGNCIQDIAEWVEE